MSTLSKFGPIQLAGYNPEQLAFINQVQHDYESDEFYGLQADYREELDALASYA